jgi:hypothetical protein
VLDVVLLGQCVSMTLDDRFAFEFQRFWAEWHYAPKLKRTHKIRLAGAAGKDMLHYK